MRPWTAMSEILCRRVGLTLACGGDQIGHHTTHTANTNREVSVWLVVEMNTVKLILGLVNDNVSQRKNQYRVYNMH
jgi:hypothetical protein